MLSKHNESGVQSMHFQGVHEKSGCVFRTFSNIYGGVFAKIVIPKTSATDVRQCLTICFLNHIMGHPFGLHCPNLVVNYPLVVSYPHQCYIGFNVNF